MTKPFNVSMEKVGYLVNDVGTTDQPFENKELNVKKETFYQKKKKK